MCFPIKQKKIGKIKNYCAAVFIEQILLNIQKKNEIEKKNIKLKNRFFF